MILTTTCQQPKGNYKIQRQVSEDNLEDYMFVSNYKKITKPRQTLEDNPKDSTSTQGASRATNIHGNPTQHSRF